MVNYALMIKIKTRVRICRVMVFMIIVPGIPGFKNLY
jgi:hypothetical protein